MAAFSHNNKGDNPTGVVLCNKDVRGENSKKQIGYSETAFLGRMDGESGILLPIWNCHSVAIDDYYWCSLRGTVKISEQYRALINHDYVQFYKTMANSIVKSQS